MTATQTTTALTNPWQLAVPDLHDWPQLHRDAADYLLGFAREQRALMIGLADKHGFTVTSDVTCIDEATGVAGSLLASFTVSFWTRSLAFYFVFGPAAVDEEVACLQVAVIGSEGYGDRYETFYETSNRCESVLTSADLDGTKADFAKKCEESRSHALQFIASELRLSQPTAGAPGHVWSIKEINEVLGRHTKHYSAKEIKSAAGVHLSLQRQTQPGVFQDVPGAVFPRDTSVGVLYAVICMANAAHRQSDEAVKLSNMQPVTCGNTTTSGRAHRKSTKSP